MSRAAQLPSSSLRAPTPAELDRRPTRRRPDRSRPDTAFVENFVLANAPPQHGAFPTYGSIHGPLAGAGFQPVEKRMIVIGICIQRALQKLDPCWDCDFDTDLQGDLSGFVFSRPNGGTTVGVSISGRFVRIGAYPAIGLAWIDAGTRVLRALAAEAGAALGGPFRSTGIH